MLALQRPVSPGAAVGTRGERAAVGRRDLGVRRRSRRRVAVPPTYGFTSEAARVRRVNSYGEKGVQISGSTQRRDEDDVYYPLNATNGANGQRDERLIVIALQLRPQTPAEAHDTTLTNHSASFCGVSAAISIPLAARRSAICRS